MQVEHGTLSDCKTLGPDCTKLGEDNPGIWKIKGKFTVKRFVYDALKRIDKIFWWDAFEQKKKKTN